MSKIKVVDFAREMQEDANKLLSSVQQSRKEAQAYEASLRKLEEGILQAEARVYEEARRRQEEERLVEEQKSDTPAQDAPQVTAALESVAPDAPVAAEKAADVPPPEATPAQVPSVLAEKPSEPAPAPEPQTTTPEQAMEKAPEKTPEPARPVVAAPAAMPVRPPQQTPQPSAGQQPAARKPALAPRPQQAAGPRPPVPGLRPPMPPSAAGPRPPVPGLQPRPIAPGGIAPGGPRPPYPPRPAGQQGGYPPRPAGQSGYAPRPGGQQTGFGPRPGGQQGGFGPRPGGQQGGFGPRPGGQQGGFAPRPGGQQGGFAPRPAGVGGGAGRFGGGGFQKKPDIQPAAEKERVSNYDPNKSLYERRPENDKKNKTKKTLNKEAPPVPVFDDDGGRNRKMIRGRKQLAQKMAPIVIEHAVMTNTTITVKDLTEKLGKPSGELIKKLFLLGIMATINQEIDFDTAQLVASEYGITLEYKPEKTAEDTMIEVEHIDLDAEKVTRPPVVTIMGHVDHGKTSLLDYIRKADVAAGEAGGITQHIGAYTISTGERAITFLDTPGHEAFTSMRARGAQVTDIAIVVVAADDGIMPQTVEAINHAKAAKVPIIVAVNKIDTPRANPSRVKQMLMEHELVAEEFGGDTVVCDVSAKTGEGVERLLEMILLTADVQELSANPNRLAKGAIVEAQLDRGRGPVATVLVQNGTLRVGDTVVAGTAYGRVRAMVDDKGRRVSEAGPSIPVEVIGFGEVPEAGDILNAVEDDRLSRLVAEERIVKQRAEQFKASARVSLDDLYTQIEKGEVKDLNIIVKADVQGSVEAVRQSLTKLSTEEVKVKVIHGGVGAISAADVMLATVSGAIIIGFNVRPDNAAREAADRDHIDIRLYRIIYQAIEDMEKAMKGLLAPRFKETILGRADVRQTFKVTGVGTIAGCHVTDGAVRRNAQIRLLRDNVVVHEGKIDSLKRFKEDAREVAAGYECGIGILNYNDVKDGDVMECFLVEQEAVD